MVVCWTSLNASIFGMVHENQCALGWYIQCATRLGTVSLILSYNKTSASLHCMAYCHICISLNVHTKPRYDICLIHSHNLYHIVFDTDINVYEYSWKMCRTFAVDRAARQPLFSLLLLKTGLVSNVFFIESLSISMGFWSISNRSSGWCAVVCSGLHCSHWCIILCVCPCACVHLEWNRDVYNFWWMASASPFKFHLTESSRQMSKSPLESTQPNNTAGHSIIHSFL